MAAPREFYRRLIEAVYKRWNEEKMGDISRIMEKYEGQENEIYDKVVRKYVFNQGETVWRPLVEAMYQRFNPTKLPELGKILSKYKDSEAALFKALCDKYIPHVTVADEFPVLDVWGAPVRGEKRQAPGSPAAPSKGAVEANQGPEAAARDDLLSFVQSALVPVAGHSAADGTQDVLAASVLNTKIQPEQPSEHLMQGEQLLHGEQVPDLEKQPVGASGRERGRRRRQQITSNASGACVVPNGIEPEASRSRRRRGLAKDVVNGQNNGAEACKPDGDAVGTPPALLRAEHGALVTNEAHQLGDDTSGVPPAHVVANPTTEVGGSGLTSGLVQTEIAPEPVSDPAAEPLVHDRVRDRGRRRRKAEAISEAVVQASASEPSASVGVHVGACASTGGVAEQADLRQAETRPDKRQRTEPHRRETEGAQCSRRPPPPAVPAPAEACVEGSKDLSTAAPEQSIADAINLQLADGHIPATRPKCRAKAKLPTPVKARQAVDASPEAAKEGAPLFCADGAATVMDQDRQVTATEVGQDTAPAAKPEAVPATRHKQRRRRASTAEAPTMLERALQQKMPEASLAAAAPVPPEPLVANVATQPDVAPLEEPPSLSQGASSLPDGLARREAFLRAQLMRKRAHAQSLSLKETPLEAAGMHQASAASEGSQSLRREKCSEAEGVSTEGNNGPVRTVHIAGSEEIAHAPARKEKRRSDKPGTRRRGRAPSNDLPATQEDSEAQPGSASIMLRSGMEASLRAKALEALGRMSVNN